MSQLDFKETLKTAADIYLRFSQDPDDPGVLAERDEFLARGHDERRAWAQIKDAWQVTGSKPKSRKLLSLVLVGLLAFSAYFAAEPLRILMVADQRSDDRALTVTLASGDLAVLDANSALVDDTEADGRDVELLNGAAYFDVLRTGEHFEVAVGDARVVVLGTAFEVAKVSNGVHVAVEEGRVAVFKDGRRLELGAGESVVWTGTGPMRTTLEPDRVATWRDGRLVVENVPFSQVVSILDRHIVGPVVVASNSLNDARVTGSFDLDRAMVSLRNLAASQSGSVVTSPLGGAVIFGGL